MLFRRVEPVLSVSSRCRDSGLPDDLPDDQEKNERDRRADRTAVAMNSLVCAASR